MTADIETFWRALETATDPTAYKPRRNTAVVVSRLTNRDQPYYVLKEPTRKTYIRLSEEDYALWWQMNGDYRIKDLFFYSLKRYKSLPVGHLTSVINELRRGGFLQDESINLYEQIEAQLQAQAPESHGRKLINRFLHSEIARDGLDPFFSKLHPYTRPLFHPIAHLFFLLLILSGTLLFGLLYNRHIYTLTNNNYPVLVTLIVANLLVIGLHELAHALATKQIGRELDRGGFLLYWGLPAFFVDTRDAWLSSSRHRILVSWAGPYSGLILGSIIGWLLTAVNLYTPQLTVTYWETFLYQIGFLSYLSVLINLNPLLELDGYFILMDWLEMPGLRGRAFRFWRQGLWPKLKETAHPAQFWQTLSSNQRIFLWFGALAFVYSGFALWLAFNFWRLRLVPFVQTLWAAGVGGQLIVLLLTVMVVIPTMYALAIFGWSRLRRALEWLSRRNLLARPDVLTLLTAVPILLGLPLVWLGLAKLPAGYVWQPLFVWLLHGLVAIQLVGVARQLTGSRFQWALWALTLLPLALSFAWLMPITSVWRELAFMIAATAVFASGVVAWFTVKRHWLGRTDHWLMAIILAGGVGTLLAMNALDEQLFSHGRWLAPTYVVTAVAAGLALFVPVLLNFVWSRFALAWGLLTLNIILLPWLLLFPALHLPLLGLWLLAANLYWLLGELAQFARYDLPASQLSAFSERDRLVYSFDHFMSALFSTYETIFGKRRLRHIQAKVAQAGPLSPDLSILQMAERARHSLLLAVDHLDDLAGTPFTQKAGQAAYDSLPWLEAETLARHLLSQTQWGAGLAQGFIRAHDRRTYLVRQADVFAGLDQAGVEQVTAVMQEKSFRKNSSLGRAGQPATHFYLIDSGEVGVYNNDELTAVLRPGSYFGTAALAGQGSYSYTYRTLAPSQLFAIASHQFDPLLRADTTLAYQLRTGAKERALLRKMPLFSSLSPQQLAALDTRLQPRQVAANELFVRQGDPRSSLFIIINGLVQLFVEQDGQEQLVGVLGPGEHFGEYALFADTPYHASCRALVDTDLLLLDEPAFDKLVAHCEQMTQYVEQLGSSRLLASQRQTALPL